MICPQCFNEKNTQMCPYCGYVYDINDTDSDVLEPGTLISIKYTIGKVIGRGGFGITYLAKDNMTNKLCAIKEYYPNNIVTRNESNTVYAYTENRHIFEEGKNSFIEEAKVLYKIQNYPGVVKVENICSEFNTAYIVMEYLEGMNLKQFVSKYYGGRFPVDQALLSILTVAKAMENVHNIGLIHRDISPENIFVSTNEDRKGQLTLIDFGASRAYLGKSLEGMSVYLKPGYAPPEQYSCDGVQGPWTDIYALATTFYVLVTGRKVMESYYRVTEDTLEPIANVEPSVSLELSNVISKAMEPDYHRRYQTMGEFIDAIEATRKKLIPTIKMLNGASAGKEMSINPDTDIYIGRDATVCQFVLSSADKSVGRNHCLVRYDSNDNSFYVKDFSKNGTRYENNQRFSEYKFTPDSKIFIASSNNTMLLYLKRRDDFER